MPLSQKINCKVLTRLLTSKIFIEAMEDFFISILEAFVGKFQLLFSHINRNIEGLLGCRHRISY